jgi:hypothetical protein
MAYVVRSGTVRRVSVVAGRQEPPTQVIVVHHDDTLGDKQVRALDAVMAELDDYRTVEHVDGNALSLLHTLAYPGKREIILVLTSPRDLDKVLAQIAALRSF